MTTVIDVAPLDRAVDAALASRDHSGLHVIGYGEITSVLAWPDADGPWACKRLPIFDTIERLDAYRARFDEYVATLRGRGVRVQESRLEVVAKEHGFTAYIVQPAIEPDDLGPAVLRDAGDREGRALLMAVMDHISAVASPTVGLDAQLSNWACPHGELTYFDISTPMLRDASGRDLLDTELFLSSLPALLRPVVRRFLLSSILDQFFTSRATALDLAANLYKERLSAWVPVTIEIANERLGLDPPLTVDETRRYYRRDMRVWGALQTVRRLDREWQQRIRRRPYPWLLPGRINRSL